MYGEVPYLVLEWLDGAPLSNIIANQKKRNDIETVKFLHPIVEALSVAHENIDGKIIVHRDLKPENIFVLENQSSLKLLDFGIAKIFDRSEDVSHRQTSTNQQFRAFSAQYGAPEQFLPKKFGGTGPWTDVYALGLIFAELVLAKRVYEEDDYGELLLMVTDPKQRPTPRQLGASVSDDFENMCAKCVALNPQDRFKNAGEVLNYIATNFELGSIGKSFEPKKASPSTKIQINTVLFDENKISTRNNGRRLTIFIPIFFIIAIALVKYFVDKKDEHKPQEYSEIAKPTPSDSSSTSNSSQPLASVSTPDASNKPANAAPQKSSNITLNQKPSSAPYKRSIPNNTQPTPAPQTEQNQNNECQNTCNKKSAKCNKSCQFFDDLVGDYVPDFNCMSKCDAQEKQCLFGCLLYLKR